MLGGIHTDLWVALALLFLSHTGTLCRAESDVALVTLPDWRANSDYVTQCFDDRRGAFNCDWTRTQQITGEVTVDILESRPLGLQGEACLEFWYLTPADAEGSEFRALLKTSAGLVEIWSSPALPGDSWRQVFVPVTLMDPATQVVFQAVQAAPMEGQVTVNRIGVRRGQCGAQCDSNTDMWTDQSSRCLCSDGQLSCSPSVCPQGQICGLQRRDSRGIFASGTCTIHGDTDCSTFDGVLLRFMAPCSYVLAKSCSPSEALPVFSVEVVNEQNGNSSLSTVQQVIVEVANHRVSLLRTQTHRVVVNGVWKKLPLRLRNFHIKNNPAAVLLRTSFGLSISYDRAGAVHITVPTKYSDKVCGLCGNFNHVREDDFTMPDGDNARDATALAESWKTGPSASSCETMLVPDQCDPTEVAEYASELYCGSLLSRSGPLAACLTVVEAESYFRGCMAGMCSSHGDPAVLCETLNVYAGICQEAGVTLPPWRNSTICTPRCGENSHFNSCADGCPDVCSSLDISGSCGSCEERCECDSGFKLNGGKCVPAEDCGCWYKGKHYQKGETLMEGDCVQQCQCMGDDYLQCRATQCADNEVCKTKDGVKGCFAFTPATCAVYGDPHYITFDGMAYDFQGGCSYTLTTTCGAESAVRFSVIGHNTHPTHENFTRAKLQAVTLQVDDLKLTLNMSREVYVNNNPVPIPFYTNGSYGSVFLEALNNFLILESTFGLRVLIDGQHRLFLQVDERYKYELCGLCGTFSEHQDDDFVTPGGQNATGPFEFGDSWRLPGNNDCVAHPNNPRVCDYDQENEAYIECYALLEDSFRPCHETIHPSIYLSSCVYDYCATNGDQYTLCESLESYAAACEVAGVELPNWQTGTVCDAATTTAPSTSPSPTPDQTLCPMNCDFENNLCGWEQLIQDSFDWTRTSGPTPSDLTGPNQDHTTGAGFYMYIEGDSVTHGDSARMMSSMCNLDGPLCLNFWYHMHGSATAMALNIYLLKGNRATKLWSRANNQGPTWHRANIEISAAGPFQIIVEGIRGSTHQSDVAVDDISIHFGSCSGSFPSPIIGTSPPPTAAEMLSLHTVCSFDCTFDSSLCSWNQMMTDAFDWTWNSGSTPTQMTGPSADHTGDGHYLYIEASSVTHGDTARLISSECTETGPQCLHFWYHMHGSADTMGLNVYLLENRLADAIWWKRNDQGNMWQLAEVEFTPTGAYKIIIEGRRGSNEESDVAIDDVMLYHGRCADLSDVVTSQPRPDGNTTAPVPTTAAQKPPLVNDTAQPPGVTVTLPPEVVATTDLIISGNVTEASDNTLPPHPVCQIDCNFEQDICQWSQLLADVFDWTRHRGATPSMMTGPSSDHTTGDGHYLYIEANSATHGDTARLISAECTHSGPQCLQFWYHMYGSADTMGLHVYLLQDRLAEAVFWKRNDQGNVWHLAQVDITTAGNFQIIFEGRRGSNDQSDVAIDDVSLHYGRCADLVKPVTPAPTFDNLATTVSPELPLYNSTTATTTPAPTHSNTQTPTTQRSTTNQKTETPDVQTTTPSLPITTSTTVNTATPEPGTTEHQEHETSEQPGTEGPQTTAWTDNTATSVPNIQTTAQLQPTSEGPESPTESQTQPQTTARPQPTSEGPESPTESPTQPQSTARPQPPSEGPESPTESQTQPQTTARPQPTSEGPESPTESQTQPQTTARPQPTSDGPESPTESQTQPQTTAQPVLTTTARPVSPTTAQPTTAQPQPPTTAHPVLTTTAQPQPPTTAKPSTAQPQPPTTAKPSTAQSQPPTTAQPQPPATAKPSTAQPQPPTTAPPEPPTTAKPTTAQPKPPTTSQPQPPTTAKPEPPTTAEPEPPTTARPQPPTTAKPQPPTTAQPKPPTTAEPQPPTTSQPQPPTTAKPEPTTTAETEPPTTAETEPPTTAKPTTAEPQPPTTAQPQPPTTAKPERPTTAEPEPPTTAQPESPTTAKLTTAQPQPPTTAKPEPPTTAEPQTPPSTHTPSTEEPQPTTTVHPQPPTTARPQPTITGNPSTTRKPNPTTAPSCPEDSHYTACIPACSPTCSYLNGPPHCNANDGCVLGCVCDDGFVQKGRDCVPIQHCGCVDRNGTKHQFNEVWYTSHCTHECKCKRDHGVGRIECEDEDECDGDAVCLQNNMGDYYCQSTGFSECTINGDPEYRTFDRFKHDFEGRHSYVLVRTKNLPSNLQDVYIVGINRPTDSEEDSHHHHDSSEEDSRRVRDEDEDEDEDDEHDDDSEENREHGGLRELKIQVYNHTVEFKKSRRLVMDGKRTNTPVSLPGLNIRQRSSRIYLKTDFGLSVEFDGHGEAEIILPKIYKRKAGGLCGNFDGRKQNDLTKPDGSKAQSVQEFGESWRVLG